MNTRPLFQLDNRLLLCAQWVSDGAKVADIGTDHAYLPIWLAKSCKIASAVAADVREGPLSHARENILRYHVQKIVSARLSDGLSGIHPDEADTIIIAGMGGELIAEILGKAPWLKDSGKTLILQPMTSALELRVFLQKQGWALQKEKAVRSLGRLYTVMLVHAAAEDLKNDELYPYIGALEPAESSENRDYILREANRLEKRRQGMLAKQQTAQADELLTFIKELQKLAKRGENHDNSR